MFYNRLDRKNDGEKGIETVGILPIPLINRTMRPGMLYLILALASASATTPLLGLIFNGVGLENFILIEIVATTIGIIPAMLMSLMGRQVPVISLVMARRTFGVSGATVLAVVYTFIGAGWFGLNTDVGAGILSVLFHGHRILWIIALGSLQTLIVFFGMNILKIFYKYTAPIFIACYTILAFYLFTHYKLRIPIASNATSWGRDVDLLLGFGLLAWSYDYPTVTRFCTPINSNEKHIIKLLFMAAPVLGGFSASLIMGSLGIISIKMTGEWNIAILGRSIPIWGEIASIGVILAIAHTNAMNLYVSVAKFLAVADVFYAPYSMLQPLTVILLGILSTGLAIADILHFLISTMIPLSEASVQFADRC